VKDLVLVDAQPGRVRLFREAIAIYRERFAQISARSDDAVRRAHAQVERAREASRALHGAFAMRKAQRRDGGSADEEVRLHVFPCKEEALKFLRQEAPYEWAPRAAVVFTDLYLEETAGGSMIEQIKADAILCAIPTVTLCAGASALQIRDAWDAGSNAVVDVSGEPPAMLAQVADTLEFWLHEAAL
jgi:CheY-like chemotaxis protein